MSSSSPSVPTTTESKEEEEEEDADYKKICEEYNHLLETIPKAKESEWKGVEPIYNYYGFWFFPAFIKSSLLLHTYFKPEPSDIFLASFIKTGTTWLKALMFSTLNRDLYTFSDHYLHHHGPHNAYTFLDLESYPLTNFNRLPAPRLFATHFPRTILPPQITSCKFVYICREPKDVLISKWHFANNIMPKNLPPLSLDDAVDQFCKGLSVYEPFWEHVLSYWKASLESPDKILFLKYEDAKKEPEVVVRKLAAFVGKPFTAEKVEKGVVEDIVKLCNFKNLSNLEVNKKSDKTIGKVSGVEMENRHYFRKGGIGDWKNYLTEEMKQQRIDGITHEKFKGSGLVFDTSA